MTLTILTIILTGLVNVSVLLGFGLKIVSLATRLENRLTVLETESTNTVKSIDEVWRQFNEHRNREDRKHA